MESNLNDIDWSAPWLTHLRDIGNDITASRLGQACQRHPSMVDDAGTTLTSLSLSTWWRTALNGAAEKLRIRNHLNLPVQFIAQHELPHGVAYESHISATGNVPMRDNLHDFFNALVWLTFPKIKGQLNALQAKQIERCGIGKSRGAARDAATLFDENAALLAVTDSAEGQVIVQALRTHQWNQLFVEQRQQFITHAEVIAFGHALMEKLARPYKAITAHTIVCWVEPHFHELSDNEKCAQLDQQIAYQLEHTELIPSVFSPLPILGVPGWWADQTAHFYADKSVFRPLRENTVALQ